MTSFIPIFEPYLNGNEKKYLIDCINTNWISSQGKYIIDFEESLSNLAPQILEDFLLLDFILLI